MMRHSRSFEMSPENLYLESYQLNVRMSGKSDLPAIVLIHGAGADSTVWDRMARRMATRLRVVTLDLPGHGRSMPRSSGNLIRAYADAVEETIRSLRLKSPAVGGHSLGGAVALTLALDEPDLVGKLVLMGSGARLRVLPAALAGMRDNFEAAIMNITQYSYGPDAPPQAIQAGVAMMRRFGRDVVLPDFEACNAFDIMDRLDEITAPTLAICGEADVLTPLKYSQYLAEKMPDCKLRAIPRAGHMVMLETPDLLSEILVEFLLPDTGAET